MLYSLRYSKDADKAWLEKLRRLAYEDLFYATWGGWDERRHQQHFTESWRRGNIQLIEVDGRLVGMVQLKDSKDYVEVGEIQILPAHQGKGIGTQVLVGVIDRARKQGRDVILATGLMNAGAHRLYLRLGFEEVGRSDTHIHMRHHTSK